jgi:hypothetical protein
MRRWLDAKAFVVAVAFFGFGFFVADHMLTAKAETASSSQEVQGASFSGSEGALVVKTGQGQSIIIIRGNKLWKLDPAQTQGNSRVWGTLGE